MEWIAGGFIWLIGWMITWPALLALFQQDKVKLSLRASFLSHEDFRQTMGMAMFFAALPPMWILTPFITGFYVNGFVFTYQGIQK